MKTLKIFIDFDSLKNNLTNMEKGYPSIVSSEKIFKDVGFSGGVLKYDCSGDKLSTEEFFFLVIDYVARICWAFHSQNKIIFLKNYKDTFFDFKILKISEEQAFDKLLKFEKEHKFQSHGLVNLFSYCSVFLGSDESWCDGLRIINSEITSGRIGIVYTISNDFKTRVLLNPIQFKIFKRLQYIEHISSLNLVIFLFLSLIKKNEKKVNHYTEIINESYNYFIENPKLLKTPQISNDSVYKFIYSKL